MSRTRPMVREVVTVVMLGPRVREMMTKVMVGEPMEVTEFPIVSSSSSTLEEPVYVSEEPKDYNAKPIEVIFPELPKKNT